MTNHEPLSRGSVSIGMFTTALRASVRFIGPAGAYGIVLPLALMLLTSAAAAPLAAPKLESPPKSAADVSLGTALTWKPVAGSSGFDYEVASGGKTAFSGKVAAGKTSSPHLQLQAGQTYSWRVRAKTSKKAGPWSDRWTFVTRPGRGVSLHIGLNGLDPAGYAGQSGLLTACENDARAMQAIANNKGYASQLLLTREATSAAVLDSIAQAASQLQPGDTFWITYSGHGGQVRDTNGDETDGRDETWCLYNRQVIDDELYAQWARFKPGVRLLILSDSCHSGTVAKALALTKLRAAGKVGTIRALPQGTEELIYQLNQQLYDGLQSGIPKNIKASIRASVLLISGCQDDQYSCDGSVNGAFTQALLQVWNNGAFREGYPAFYRAICPRLLPCSGLPQRPNYYLVGPKNPKFEAQRPFSL